MSEDTIGNLVVIADDPSDSPWVRKATEPVIEGALDILESARGFAALKNYAEKLVVERNAQGSTIAYNIKDSRAYVQNFLDKLRDDFPIVHGSQIDADGETHPEDWGEDPWQYNPKDAGIIKLNYTILLNMVHVENLVHSLTEEAKVFDDEAKEQGKIADRATSKKEAYETEARYHRRRGRREEARKSQRKASEVDRDAKEAIAQKAAAKKNASVKRASAKNARDNHIAFQFHMIITVAHELVHLFTRYINGGNSGAQTPPHVTSPHFGHDPGTGEAGGYWETLVFKGAIHFYENLKDPLGSRQAGVPYLLEGNSCKEVRKSYMEDIVNGDLSFPAKTYSKEISLKDLERPMLAVRKASLTIGGYTQPTSISTSCSTSSSSQGSIAAESVTTRWYPSPVQYANYSGYGDMTQESSFQPGTWSA